MRPTLHTRRTARSGFLALLVLTLGAACHPPPRPPAPVRPPQSVILKLDDLYHEDGSVHAGWREVFDFLNAGDIVATVGLVGRSLEEKAPAYHAWIGEQHRRGHEIWHHGYCHCRPRGADGAELAEFRGTSLDYQLRQLRRTQTLAHERLGFALRTFGAPYNATDSLTARALAQLPEIAVWLYPAAGPTAGKFSLVRTPVNLEYPVHVPNFERFRAAYEQHRDAAVLVLQGHPRSWVAEPERMRAFQRIVGFLREEGVRFTTPYAYYLANSDR